MAPQVLSYFAFGGKTTPVWSYPEVTGKGMRKSPHSKLASTSRRQWDVFFYISKQLSPYGGHSILNVPHHALNDPWAERFANLQSNPGFGK